MKDLSTRYLGWCPVCERDIKVRDNALVHHGYQRPGHGYIVGDCFGVGYEPYEVSSRCCKEYLKLVLDRVKTYSSNLRVLESPKGPEYLYFEKYDFERRMPVMFKIKTHAWLDRLRDMCAGDDELFADLS